MEKTKRMWNFIFLIMTTVCCLSLTSCGSDDEDDNNSSNDPQKALIGTWQSKFIDNGDEVIYTSYTFKKDGTYIYKDWYEGEERNPDITTGTWYIDEDYIYTTDDDEGNSRIYKEKYMLNGKTLLLNDMIYTKK